MVIAAGDNPAAADVRVWAKVAGVLTLIFYQFKGEKGQASLGKARLQREYKAVEQAVAR